MSGKKAVDKVSKGLTSLIDEFSSAVNQDGERWRRDQRFTLAGGSSVIKAAVDATG